MAKEEVESILPEEENLEEFDGDFNIEEEITSEAEKCGVNETNFYYRMIKNKQKKNIESIESTGACDKRGKPGGFRRA